MKISSRTLRIIDESLSVVLVFALFYTGLKLTANMTPLWITLIIWLLPFSFGIKQVLRLLRVHRAIYPYLIQPYLGLQALYFHGIMSKDIACFFGIAFSLFMWRAFPYFMDTYDVTCYVTVTNIKVKRRGNVVHYRNIMRRGKFTLLETDAVEPEYMIGKKIVINVVDRCIFGIRIEASHDNTWRFAE
jgi:hypothetical protein